VHFAAAMNGIPRPLELSQRQRLVLGYYGVIDERVDLQLVADVADLRPDWTIALVGPVAKIDPQSLPVRDNIVVLGKQSYDDLPGFLACFDVALMPFALNDATRAISPTKTLEYLAGGKPVVSTPIADVVALYAEIVRIAETAPQVVAEAESLLQQSGEERRAWHIQAQLLVREHSWDAIATDMMELMSRATRAYPAERLIESAVALTA
jgi:glycosyltransferase involved in cell wall biosynthesis